MNKRTAITFAAILFGSALVAALVFGVHLTLFGIACKHFGSWQEESFVGMPLPALREYLGRDGRGLTQTDSDSLQYITGTIVGPDERVWYFTKGPEYPWFRVMSAINIGYVVVRKEGDSERVIRIDRHISLDGP